MADMTILKIALFDGKTHYKLPFSIASSVTLPDNGFERFDRSRMSITDLNKMAMSYSYDKS